MAHTYFKVLTVGDKEDRCPRCCEMRSRDRHICSIKDQRVNTFIFVGQITPVKTIQFCCNSTEGCEASGHTWLSDCKFSEPWGRAGFSEKVTTA